jgi:murein DD-endopeptidase MepM/ murein hydrolase activator NlpD
MHLRVDIAADLGTPIRAAECGKVLFPGWAAATSSCSTCWGMIAKCSGMATLSGFALEAGARLVAGQVIGYAGSTGRSTGSHLHFEVRPEGGEPIDPEVYYR